MQRDLLPLIEGTTVSTKHGPVKTDHVLFIASGAFLVSKPSDLLPELQGRLPIRVELKPLGEEDFRRILTDTEASLIKQYVALMGTEGVTLDFRDDAIAAIARAAFEVNSNVENIGARRLQTILERVLDEVSFTATDRAGETIVVDANSWSVKSAAREECRSLAVHPVGCTRCGWDPRGYMAITLPWEAVLADLAGQNVDRSDLVDRPRGRSGRETLKLLNLGFECARPTDACGLPHARSPWQVGFTP